jgi:outer membrane protein OmpA-like peptidoglycan-associated protein
MKRNLRKPTVVLVLAMASVLLGLASCKTSPDPSAVLEQARSAVTQAEADPNVTKYAPIELDRARKLLVSAQNAAQAKDEAASHYAYLTTQMARIAQQRAQEQLAITRLKAGEIERQKILDLKETAQVRGESQGLAAPFENLKASQTSRGIVVKLDEVVFDTGKASLNPGAERPIEQIVSFLGENPDRRVQVEAFTDSQGGNDYNIELSQSRADAVAMAILRRGINAERVRAIGYGSDGGRQQTRRLEIIVSNGDAAIPGRAPGAP